MEIKEIREFADYVVNRRHSERISQQKEDQEMFEDTFVVPHIDKAGQGEEPRKASYEIRTGFVAEMANGFTEQLIDSVPRVYTKGKEIQGKVSKEREASADRIANTGNKWAYVLGNQAHNPFKQTFKYLAFTRGESWIYIPHRSELAQWKGKEPWQELYPDIIPVHFILYDPLIVFHEPTEDIDGQPQRAVVWYKRKAIDIHSSYPYWTKYEKNKPDADIQFMLYIGKDTIYAEADDEPLFRDAKKKLVNGDGRRTNLYKCTPLAHTYSGWGGETENKDPSLLAYSRTRMVAGRVKEDTSMAADFSYNIHAFAYRHRTIINQSGQELSKNAFTDYHPNDPGRLSFLDLPPQAEVKVEETQLFDEAAFAYRNLVKADLALAYPNPLRGVASGSSGRQEDILSGAGLSFYDCAVKNNSNLWANAFWIALKECRELPDMMPQGLNKEDLDNCAEIIVDTKRDDPMEAMRLAADGDRKYQLGIIDSMTNLVEYQKKTKAEAKMIEAKKKVEMVFRDDPILRTMLAMRIAREIEMEDEYKAMVERQGAQGGLNATPNYGAKGGPPREGNVQTPTGQEMPDMSLERRPPRVSGEY